jgi:hypothetical protein
LLVWKKVMGELMSKSLYRIAISRAQAIGGWGHCRDLTVVAIEGKAHRLATVGQAIKAAVRNLVDLETRDFVV